MDDQANESTASKQFNTAVQAAERDSAARLKAFRTAIGRELESVQAPEKGSTALPRLARFGSKPAPLHHMGLHKDRPLSYPATACQILVVQPPYLTGHPTPPATQLGTGAGAVSYAHADAAAGRFGLLAVTYDGDPTAETDANTTYRTAQAHLLTWGFWAPINGTMRARADFIADGSSLVIARGWADPVGYAYTQAQFQLNASLAHASKATDPEGPCRVEGDSPSIGYKLGVQPVKENIRSGLELSVKAGELVFVTLTATVLVGVSKGSNLYATLNLSPLQNWYQKPGSVEVPTVWIEFC
jgi:hypothetical protein